MSWVNSFPHELSLQAVLLESLQWILPWPAQTKTQHRLGVAAAHRHGLTSPPFMPCWTNWCVTEANTSIVSSSLTARLHRRLHSGCTHLQRRLFPAGHRFCETFCNPRFVFIKKILRAERNVTVVLENLIWVGKRTEADQMFCSAY